MVYFSGMKKPSILLSMILASLIGLGQTLEYSEVHWGFSDAVSKRLHIKEVVEIENLNQDELRDRIDNWLNIQMVNEQIMEWRKNGDVGGQRWFPVFGEPYEVDNKYRIWTKYIKCKDCVKQFKNSKKGSEGLYRIDFRFKDEKLLVVMSSFYSMSFKMTLDNWMVNKNELAIGDNDARAIALTNLFKSVRDDFKDFLTKAPSNKEIDNW